MDKKYINYRVKHLVIKFKKDFARKYPAHSLPMKVLEAEGLSLERFAKKMIFPFFGECWLEEKNSLNLFDKHIHIALILPNADAALTTNKMLNERVEKNSKGLLFISWNSEQKSWQYTRNYIANQMSYKEKSFESSYLYSKYPRALNNALFVDNSLN